MVVNKSSEYVPLREAALMLGYRTRQSLAYHLATNAGGPTVYEFSARERFLLRSDVIAYAERLKALRERRQTRRGTASKAA